MNKHRASGYTLTQILTVLGIIGVLSAIAIPLYQDYQTRARVAESLGFLDAARTRLEVDWAGGNNRTNQADLLNSPEGKVDMMTALTWKMGGASDKFAGYILAEMDLPGFGVRKVLAFELRSTGDWHCVSAAKFVPAGEALDEKYLPPQCREGAAVAKLGSSTAKPPATGGGSTAPAAPTCSSSEVGISVTDDQGKPAAMCVPACAAGEGRSEINPTQCCPTADLIDLVGQKECLPPCPAGQKRSDADPGLCVPAAPKPAVPLPSASTPRSTPDFASYPDPRFPELVAGETATRDDGCGAGQFSVKGGSTSRCVVAPEYRNLTVATKPTAATNPCPPGYVFAPDDATTFWDTPVRGSCVVAGNYKTPYDPIQCQVCAGPEFLCEKLITEQTCEYPNNFCVNRLENRVDGTRAVIHRCGNYRDAAVEWWSGTSDDDRCRKFDENFVYTNAMHCTYACITDNCNLPVNTTRAGLDVNWKLN